MGRNSDTFLDIRKGVEARTRAGLDSYHDRGPDPHLDPGRDPCRDHDRDLGPRAGLCRRADDPNRVRALDLDDCPDSAPAPVRLESFRQTPEPALAPFPKPSFSNLVVSYYPPFILRRSALEASTPAPRTMPMPKRTDPIEENLRKGGSGEPRS